MYISKAGSQEEPGLRSLCFGGILQTEGETGMGVEEEGGQQKTGGGGGGCVGKQQGDCWGTQTKRDANHYLHW